jgi:mRNA interferase RelE/StbE
MFKIEWKLKAVRQLYKIKDIEVTSAIKDATYLLQNWPECPNTIKLKNRPLYRMRVGSWRIIFKIDQFVRIIEIQEVKKRNERTY